MKILVSDFDHTFYDDNYLENIKSINDFVDRGNMFIIATGRSINSLNLDIRDYYIKYSYLICSDGASIYDNKHNHIFNCDIDADLINPICELLDNDENISLTLIENDNIASGTCANTIAGRFIDKENCEVLVSKINNDFPSIYAYLSDLHINIRSRKVSKYKAIEFLINKYNLNMDDIYTIGDSINDLDMCKKTKSFTFSFADISIKNVSDIIVKDFREAINILNKI